MNYGLEAYIKNMAWLFSNPGVWQQMKEGMRYFKDMEMLHIVCDMQEAFVEQSEEDTMMPKAAEQIGTFIRKHPDDFVQFED